jgi:hypothetical protein
MPGGYVYTARSDRGSVVYVGSTGNIRQRLLEHQRTSSWWAMHESLDVVEFATIGEARAAEDDAICRWDPPYNVRGGHGRTRPDCGGSRCLRRRAEAGRHLLVHDCLQVRRSRRRGAPPLHEWDVARTRDGATLLAGAGTPSTGTIREITPRSTRPGRRTTPQEPLQLELSFNHSLDVIEENVDETNVTEIAAVERRDVVEQSTMRGENLAPNIPRANDQRPRRRIRRCNGRTKRAWFLRAISTHILGRGRAGVLATRGSPFRPWASGSNIVCCTAPCLATGSGSGPTSGGLRPRAAAGWSPGRTIPV